MKVVVLRFFCLIFLAYINSSCSFLYRFMIVNKSKTPIEISYQVKSLHEEKWINSFHLPLNHKGKGTYAYTFEEQTKTIVLTLPAKKKVIIGTALNDPSMGMMRNRANLTYLNIKSDSHNIHHTVETLKKAKTSKIVVR
jgi:hypothetical protein